MYVVIEIISLSANPTKILGENQIDLTIPSERNSHETSQGMNLPQDPDFVGESSPQRCSNGAATG